ncbi:MAG: flagellar hook-length control protein FliK [Alphaproteobacteria bacterium]
MQIAFRSESPRFEVVGSASASNGAAKGQSFDELVRALGAQDAGGDRRAAISDRAGRDRDQPPAEDDRPERAAEATEDWRRDRPKAEDADVSAVDADARPLPERPADAREEGHGHGRPARERGDAAAGDGPADTDATASVETGAKRSKGAEPTRGGTSGATRAAALAAASVPAAATGSPADPNLAAGAATDAAAGSGTIKVTDLPGQSMSSTLLAQALSSRPLTPTAHDAGNGQRQNNQAASAALGRTIAGQARAAEPGQPSDAPGTPDFKAMVQAMAGNAANANAHTAPPAGAEPAPAAGNTQGMPALANAAERADGPARADAAGPAQHRPAPTGPQLADRIGVTIARAASAGADQVSIRLHPRELGRIDVRMELGTDGRMTLSVTADRPDTLEQLQRNVRDLERSLADAGFDTGGDLNFSLRQHGGSNPHGEGREGRDGSGGSGDGGHDSEPTDDGIVVTHHSGSHMVVDLFV